MVYNKVMDALIPTTEKAETKRKFSLPLRG